MKSLGLVMLTHNEEEFIADSLEAVVPFVDEAIVIDQFSTDNTVKIAQSKGARAALVDGDFSVHGEKFFRDLAARICVCDWMMIIDADEIMSDGWAGPLRHFIETEGDNFGAIELPFYHLIGSYEFHSKDSPLWRAAFVRRHPGLTGTLPMLGPFAHSNYHLSYHPNQVHRFNKAAIFHLGYVQHNLMKRWITNVRRGDYGYSKAEEEETLKMLESNLCAGLPECVPLELPLSKYPTSLQARVGRTFNVAYNPKTRRIIDRSVIA